MPIRYEERTVNELKKLASQRNIAHAYRMKKIDLIRHLRNTRTVSTKGGIKRSTERLQKYERCVNKLKNSPKIRNPYAICNTSIYGSNLKS